MDKLLKSLRRTARSGVVAMLLLGIASPACTSSHVLGPAAAANTPVHAETSSVRQQNELAPVSPLVSLDESHKSLVVEPDAEPTEACSDALYIEEPMASGYVPVQQTDALWLICNEANKTCVDSCIKALPAKKRKDKAEQRTCEQKCHKEYMVCLARAGLVKKVFNAFDTAWSWIKEHKTAIVGSIVVIGGVAYIVSTGGSGALILIPLGA